MLQPNFMWCVFEPRHDKTNKMSVRPAKTQISLGIRPVWSESSLCVQWVAKDPRFLHADSEDSDQTGRMPRLIWVFAGRTLTLLDLSCRGSFVFVSMIKIKLFRQPLNGSDHAKTCLMSYANNKDADQHPRSLISAFVVHCLDSIIPLLVIAEIPRL